MSRRNTAGRRATPLAGSPFRLGLATLLAACAGATTRTAQPTNVTHESPPDASVDAGEPAPTPAVRASSPAAATPRAPGTTIVGPQRGTLLVVGGGLLGSEILSRFVQLAGGPDARIVVLPGAGEEDTFPADWSGYQPLWKAGARNVTILHTRDRRVADREDFVAPLREARGVWIPGGRQWKLADAYLGTRTQREIRAVLERGGVVAGTSAGATILGAYLVRGAPAGNTIVMSPGHEEGFGFLRDVAIDQHVLVRHRENDLALVLAAHPRLLGVGPDEGTALEVHGDTATVLGRSRVVVYDGREHAAGEQEAKPYFFLDPGDVYDLAARRLISKA
ncbi:MAG TPA: cyanophycinase, partial [Longimicrobiales bacterium]|nr:cyanophycinase [Longimicrobiales bacterium]